MENHGIALEQPAYGLELAQTGGRTKKMGIYAQAVLR